MTRPKVVRQPRRIFTPLDFWFVWNVPVPESFKPHEYAVVKVSVNDIDIYKLRKL
jgi:hypothetical protein